MKVNLKTLAKTLQGGPYFEKPGIDQFGQIVPDEMRGEQKTLAFFIIEALQIPFDGITGEQKIKRYELGKKILTSSKETDLSIEEAMLIKEVTGKYSPVSVCGKVWELLEKKNADTVG